MDRREIIKKMEEYTGLKAKYMGVPSFSYQIGTLTIDRAGKITTSTGIEVDFERLLNGHTEEEINEVFEHIKLEVILPMDGHTGVTLRNIFNMIYSKQTLIMKAFEMDEAIVGADFVEEINKSEIQTLDDFKKVSISICKGIDFNFHKSTITFKYLSSKSEPEKLEAFKQLVTLINKSAKSLKYASPKQTDTNNDKFTMRTWLTRLGMVGDEFKITRKVLIEGLQGSSAFRNPKVKLI